MLGRSRRRRSNIKTTLGQRLVFAESHFVAYESLQKLSWLNSGVFHFHFHLYQSLNRYCWARMLIYENIILYNLCYPAMEKYINQVDSRILRCRKSYFSLNNVGMPYPGLPVDLKLHFWHTICRPILIFGLETVYLNRAMYIKLESLQGTIVKAFLGLSRYSHHSKLMTALGIWPIEESIKSRPKKVLNLGLCS